MSKSLTSPNQGKPQKSIGEVFFRIAKLCYALLKFILPSRVRSIIIRYGVRLVKALLPRSIAHSVKQRLMRRIYPYMVMDDYNQCLHFNQLQPEDLEEVRREIEDFECRPLVSLVLPVGKDTLWKNLEETIASINGQLYSEWELWIPRSSHLEKGLAGFLEEMAERDSAIHVKSLDEDDVALLNERVSPFLKGEFVALVSAGDRLCQEALYEMVRELNQNPELDYIYSDEDEVNENGDRENPFFKPDWSPDYLLSMNYCGQWSVFRKTLFDEVGGFRGALGESQLYDLILRVTEKTEGISHVARVLYSRKKESGQGEDKSKTGLQALREAASRRSLKGEVVPTKYPNYYRVKYEILKEPLVSIIIPTKDKADYLRTCVESIEKKSTYQNYEIIIVDHESQEEETKNFLANSPHKIIPYTGVFNYSRINNVAVREAKGEQLVFLNNDVEVIEPAWIENLLEHSQREEVGCVGARLLFNDEVVQHAGTVVGFNGCATNYSHFPVDSEGYFGQAVVIRNCSSVTAACMMVRNEVFEEVGGFDEGMEYSWQDVDLCLCILEIGKRVIYTPFSLLYHYEGLSRAGDGKYPPAEDRSRELYKKKHREFIEAGDPYYNPNLSLRGRLYQYSVQKTVNSAQDALIELFVDRSDLQRNFPEVWLGNVKHLANWAVTKGLESDEARWALEKFPKEDYLKISG